MIPDVISAKYIDNYKIEVSFDDGTRGIVDFKISQGSWSIEALTTDHPMDIFRYRETINQFLRKRFVGETVYT